MRMLAIVLILFSLQAHAQSACSVLFTEAPSVSELVERLTASSFAIRKSTRTTQRALLHAEVKRAVDTLSLSEVKHLARTVILSPRKSLSLTDWTIEHELLMGYLARIEYAAPGEIASENAGLKDWLSFVNEANPSAGVANDERMQRALSYEQTPRFTRELKRAYGRSQQAGEVLTSSELDYMSRLLEIHLFSKMDVRANIADALVDLYRFSEITQRPRFRTLVQTVAEHLRLQGRPNERLESELPPIQ